MLHPFIIEQIRQREQQERVRREIDRPRLHLPIDAYRPAFDEEADDDEKAERGVAILEL